MSIFKSEYLLQKLVGKGRASYCVLVGLAGLLTSTAANAHEGWTAGRPDGHAPIGVMGDHVHKKGEWMASYRYMAMSMSDLYDGHTEITVDDVLQDYRMAPVEMDMSMHMFGAMYALSDSVTAMVMVPWISNSMTMTMNMNVIPTTGGMAGMGAMTDMSPRMPAMAMPMTFETESDGVGDIKLGALINFVDHQGHKAHINAVVSAPTGSTDETATTPMADNARLPYPMQLGSGTWDLRPGVTYLGQHENISWGAQGLAVLRTELNDEGYRLGNEFTLNAWGAYRWSDTWSGSLRLSHFKKTRIKGADPMLNPMMSPTANGSLLAGRKLDAGVGVNAYIRSGVFSGHRLALEYLVPVEHHTEGPQLVCDNTLVAGWQLAF